MLLEPVLVGLDRQCPHQPQAALAIGEDAHDMGAAPDFLVEALQHIGRFEVLMVLPRQPVKRQRLVDVVFDPAGELCGLAYLGLAEAAELIRAKKLSPVEYATTLLARIERHDAKYNAFIAVTPERALTAARAAEAGFP